MDPLTPTTSTLSPAVAHIAETTRVLARSLQDSSNGSDSRRDTEDSELVKKKTQQDTVKWVLATPQRLQALLGAGKVEEAKSEWEEVESLLQQWSNVDGVSSLRVECMEAFEDSRPK